eukprot:COSAG02_NODE_36565_length_453_cov_0.731638_1_plen_56_part_01
MCAVSGLLIAAVLFHLGDAAVNQRRVLNTALDGPGESSVVPTVAGSWSGSELMSAE